MKRIIHSLVIFIGLIIIGCEGTDYSPYSYSNEETIYSDESSTSFREILLVLKPYIIDGDESLYLVTDTIRNIEICVNGQLWGFFSSFGVDSSLYECTNRSGLFFTTEQTGYEVVAPYVTSIDTLSLAGEYADLLSGYFTLEPGDYLCEIVSFELITSEQEIMKIYTGLIVPFEVRENSRSTFIGQFEILLTL